MSLRHCGKLLICRLWKLPCFCKASKWLTWSSIFELVTWLPRKYGLKARCVNTRGNRVSFPCKSGLHSTGKENHDSDHDSQLLLQLPTSPYCFFRGPAFSNGHCSTYNNTIWISPPHLPKNYFIYIFDLSWFVIPIGKLDVLHKFGKYDYLYPRVLWLHSGGNIRNKGLKSLVFVWHHHN